MNVIGSAFKMLQQKIPGMDRQVHAAQLFCVTLQVVSAGHGAGECRQVPL